jgi:hypothetical protein
LPHPGTILLLCFDKNSHYERESYKYPDCVKAIASALVIRRSKKESIVLEILKMGLIVKMEFFER